MQIVDTLKEAVDSVKTVLDVDTVIGKPLNDGNTVIIPVSKLSVGFLSAGGEVEGKHAKSGAHPLGGLGGGATISPQGFLVLDNGRARFLRIEKGEGDKWGDYADKIMDYLSRK